MENKLLLLLCLTVLNVFLVITVESLDNGLAIQPPMGWMAWERFRCNINCTEDPDNCISEKLIVQMCDKMVAGGFRDAGYTYIALDDCWAEKRRDPLTGKLVPDRTRFPRGMKALADYVHRQGMKLGIYSDMGTKTCKEYPGSEFYIQTDAQTFTDWGVDMLKLDCCYGGSGMEIGYETMGFFLNKTGRPVLYSCSYPVCLGGHVIYERVAKTCNMWRNAIDLTDSWDRVYKVIRIYGDNIGNFSAAAGPGHWNDADQLMVGDFGLSNGQQTAQIVMWAMWSVPLFMSVDLRDIGVFAEELLLNKDIIAINQDWAGSPSYRVWQDKRLPVTTDIIEGWIKHLSDGTTAIAILNGSNYGEPATVVKTPHQLGLLGNTSYIFRNVLTSEKSGPFNDTVPMKVRIPATSVYFVVATELE